MGGENRMPYLDFIRGIAILGVLIVHVKIFLVNPASPLFYLIASEGARGVQLFYILSAFTLFMTLGRSNYTGTVPQTIKYLIRRFFRIAPMFYLTALIYAIWLNASFAEFFAAITFTANFIPQYMDTLVVGQWSVIIEMFFYLLVPVLFLRIKNKEIAKKYFVGSLIASSAILLSISTLMHFLYPGVAVESWYFLAFFSLPVQLPHFLLGFYIFFLLKDSVNEKKILWKPVINIFFWTAAVELVFYIVSTALIGEHPPIILSPIIYFISAGLATIFVVICKKYEYIARIKWFSRAVEYLGKISFSMYLTHWLILVLLTKNSFYTELVKNISGYTEFVLLMIVGTTAIAAVSSLTYLVVEKGGQKLGSKISANLLNLSKPVRHPESTTIETRT